MSNELTPAEIVAVKLFGWMRIPGGDQGVQRCYESEFGDVHYVANDGIAIIVSDQWPDFTDERLAWYWIRRVEDALAEKGLYGKYLLALLEQPFPVEFAYEWPKQGMDRGTYGVWHTNRATVAQCIQAVIQVIEEDEESRKSKEVQERQTQAKQAAYRKALREKVAELRSCMGCNCDLDNWEPEELTGHSHVCRIHKAAIEAIRYDQICVAEEAGL